MSDCCRNDLKPSNQIDSSYLEIVRGVSYELEITIPYLSSEISQVFMNTQNYPSAVLLTFKEDKEKSSVWILNLNIFQTSVMTIGQSPFDIFVDMKGENLKRLRVHEGMFSIVNPVKNVNPWLNPIISDRKPTSDDDWTIGTMWIFDSRVWVQVSKEPEVLWKETIDLDDVQEALDKKSDILMPTVKIEVRSGMKPIGSDSCYNLYAIIEGEFNPETDRIYIFHNRSQGSGSTLDSEFQKSKNYKHPLDPRVYQGLMERHINRTDYYSTPSCGEEEESYKLDFNKRSSWHWHQPTEFELQEGVRKYLICNLDDWFAQGKEPSMGRRYKLGYALGIVRATGENRTGKPIVGPLTKWVLSWSKPVILGEHGPYGIIVS